MTPPWILLTFEVAEGPLVGFQAALKGLERTGGEAFLAANLRHRANRHGLMVRR